ncbi:glucose-1-phosphate adenylyltransferase [Bacillus sp. FJAT-27225]|uniref:glucose-1-phosphate adenylyltransferase n=1 Tax=Bacillus sp. FJAT-27225 TaxID=1743144 RepID=UPI00080C28F4|nr:glucose-1-phosphate adenylyltransferase [Bacillus sp. FJAT-27225]OCA91477.1 glucose-1-phosphate adenylyltransferase [Bacillus sp. FJAT-27225]
MDKKKCVAMLLAGGQGTRLKLLTEKIAKPAVPFGGKYRIIDFTLSNCTNSGIDTVGVLTQYQPMLLNSYIGIGSAWDLDRKEGGVTVLPPFSESADVKWYTGTASAVYQNLSYLRQYDPEYVLILSGDHIYKMNYEEMLKFHVEKKADVTISVVEVPWVEASRFGILETGSNMKVLEFEEKPENPKSTLASMGIYIFSWEVLLNSLESDYNNPDSSHDFGKDIIPNLVKGKERVFAYPFTGYWKDVGTVESLWEANMDLLDEKCSLDLFDHGWRIYSVNPNQPPQFISADATIMESLINEGCTIEGDIVHSVIFQGVTVGKGSHIKDSVIMPDAVIGKNTEIERAVVPANMEIPDGMVICPPPGEIVLVDKKMCQKYTLPSN